jgi:hypothetical protein
MSTSKSLADFAGPGKVPCVICSLSQNALRQEVEDGRRNGISMVKIGQWLRTVHGIDLATEARVERHFRDHVA